MHHMDVIVALVLSVGWVSCYCCILAKVAILIGLHMIRLLSNSMLKWYQKFSIKVDQLMVSLVSLWNFMTKTKTVATTVSEWELRWRWGQLGIEGEWRRRGWKRGEDQDDKDESKKYKRILISVKGRKRSISIPIDTKPIISKPALSSRRRLVNCSNFPLPFSVWVGIWSWSRSNHTMISKELKFIYSTSITSFIHIDGSIISFSPSSRLNSKKTGHSSRMHSFHHFVLLSWTIPTAPIPRYILWCVSSCSHEIMVCSETHWDLKFIISNSVKARFLLVQN